MATNTGHYSYHNPFYTGTDFQPDLLHIFIKPETTPLHSYNAMPQATWLGLFPIVSIFSGAARVVNAVEAIFKNLSNLKEQEEEARNSELWNAFKNLFRGIVEMIPATGIFLIIFESTRNAVHLSTISKELKEQKNVAGIAIEGKISMIVDLAKIDKVIKNIQPDKQITNEFRLEVYKTVCLTILKKAEERKDERGMSEIFSRQPVNQP